MSKAAEASLEHVNGRQVCIKCPRGAPAGQFCWLPAPAVAPNQSAGKPARTNAQSQTSSSSSTQTLSRALITSPAVLMHVFLMMSYMSVVFHREYSASLFVAAAGRHVPACEAATRVALGKSRPHKCCRKCRTQSRPGAQFTKQ